MSAADIAPLPKDRDSAREINATHFFTGKPCRRGHIAKRTTNRNTCVECIRVATTKYQSTAKAQQTRQEYIERKKEAGEWLRNVAHRTLKHTYGITLEQYEELFAKQNGLCAICAEPEKVPNHLTGEARRLAVDHCHQSKKIRGLLCQSCNTAIGKLRDNPELIERAAVYVRNEGVLNCQLA